MKSILLIGLGRFGKHIAMKLRDLNHQVMGTAIQRIRETVPGFDYQNGGLSLCRDGRHLSKDYGRLVAAAVWFRALTGQDVRISHFEAFDMQLVEPILAVVNSV